MNLKVSICGPITINILFTLYIGLYIWYDGICGIGDVAMESAGIFKNLFLLV